MRFLPSELVVVTVVKDSLAGIQRTSNSIAAQTARVPWLILDGGSSDGTREWVRSIAGTLNPSVRDVVDRGPYDAMNLALEELHPQGRVWFLNAGDRFVSPTSYQTVRTLSSGDDFLWGYGPVLIASQNGKILRRQPAHPYTRQQITRGQLRICHQSVVYRTGMLSACGGFDTSFQFAADYKSFIEMWLRGPATLWPEPVAIYQAGGMSDQQIWSTFAEQRRIRNEFSSRGWSDWTSAQVLDLHRLARIFLGRSLDLVARTGLAPSDWRSRAFRWAPGDSSREALSGDE